MLLPEREEFLKRVLSHVKFKYDHLDIKRELTEHMEDMYDDFMSHGIDEETATRLVVEYMGDPDEIGERLNEQHSCVLGNIWRAVRALAVIMVILSIIPAFNTSLLAVYSVFSGYSETRDRSEAIYDIKRSDTVRIDDLYFKLEEVLYYSDNDLEIRYRTWYQPFSKSVRWSFSLPSRCIYDNMGTQYSDSSGGSSAGLISRHYLIVEGFSPEAEKVIINYDYDGRKIYIEVPLKAGGSE